MLSTRRLLEQVFADNRDDELITTPARREILREHLYRELTKGAYTADERKLWADRFQRLLEGAITTDLRCHLIDVRLGVDSDSLNAMNVAARDGENSVPVEITELNERQIEALIPTEPPEPEPEADDADEAEPPGEETPSPPDRPSEPEPGPAGPDGPDLAPDDGAPASKPVAETESAAAAPDRPRALLGTSPGEYGKPRDIWFDPQAPEDRLPNPHMMITGETGSGKTQATKAILADLRPFNVPALILDFKDDYSEPVIRRSRGLQRLRPERTKPSIQPIGTGCRSAQWPRQPDAPPAPAHRHHQAYLSPRRSAGVPTARGDEGGL